MKILLIEDHEIKREKIVSLLENNFEEINLSIAHSYNSGINAALYSVFELLILDMSMPTYDKTPSEGGGRFRTFGGRDIVRQLERRNIHIPFIVLTQYSHFSENEKDISIEDLNAEFKVNYKTTYLKTIFYDTSSSRWKEELIDEIKRIFTLC